MSVTVKFTDIIKMYDGEGDFLEWLRKLQLVAKMQKVTDLTSFLPLFLSGGAFAVYEGLDEKVKSDFEQLTEALRKAFSVNRFTAFNQFIDRRLLPGESVDVFVSDLKRLAKLVGGDVPSSWIQCALIRGLPVDMQLQLKAACKLDKMNLTDTIARCRLLVTTAEANIGAVAQHRPVNKQGVKCFVCGAFGHMARQCEKRAEPPRKPRLCFVCGQEGHMAVGCPTREERKNE